MKTLASRWCGPMWCALIGLVTMTGAACAQSDAKIRPRPAAGKPLAKASPSEAAAITQAPDCFALRDEVLAKRGAKAPALHRGVVDALFNNPKEAERKLLAVIRSGPGPEEASIAHTQLAELYERSGQAGNAREQIALSSTDDADQKSKRALLKALANYPDQSVARRGYSRFEFKQTGDGIVIPVSVNGVTARFLIDTGAGISVLSESQAKSLSVAVHVDSFSVKDVAGKEIVCKLGIAQELAVGNFRLRNVPFCIIGDPAGDRTREDAGKPDAGGASDKILGLPVLLPIETIRWTRGGDFEIGFPSAHKNIARSNICFAGAGLAVETSISGKHVTLDLDTGNDVTFLYPNFAEDFAEVMKGAGAKEPHELIGFSASITVDSRKLSEPGVKIAGHNFGVHELSVLLSSPLEPDCPGCYGNVGLDLLNQAGTVTLDFRAMRLTLER